MFYAPSACPAICTSDFNFCYYATVLQQWRLCKQCAPSTALFGSSALSSVFIISKLKSQVKQMFETLSILSCFVLSSRFFLFFCIENEFVVNFPMHRIYIFATVMIYPINERFIQYECLMPNVPENLNFNDSNFKVDSICDFWFFFIRITKYKLNAHHTAVHRAPNALAWPRP